MIERSEQLMRQLSHGVYVIGVRDGELQNAFTAAWVMQISFNPLMLCISINPEHYSWQILEHGKICSVSVLGSNQLNIANHFGTSGLKDKMDGFDWQYAQTGAPILSCALSYFDCSVSHFSEAGDHKLAICHIIDGGFLTTGNPLLYRETGNMDGSKEIYSNSTP